MMKKLLLIGIITAFVQVTAWACHTPAQSAKLNKKYPDWDFVKMMHKAHNQPYKGYQFNGPINCENGQAGEFDCHNVDLVGHLDMSQIGGGQGSDSWGWKHEASGRYFALVGRSNGTSFVEITDPANPVYLGNLPSTDGQSSAWRDIKTYQDHAFIVADDIHHGMQVFNLTRLLSGQGVQTFTPDFLYEGGGFVSAHNIVINESTGFAYLVGGNNNCMGGLHMVNIQNPVAPEYVDCFDSDGYTHDAQCVIYAGPDTEHLGKEMCFASNENSITIVDVTNKSNAKLISRTLYNGQHYVHQGWLTADQKYFVIDDEVDELVRRDAGVSDHTRTYVMDMTDLDAPVFTGYYEADGSAVDHNQYIVGGHTYQANYTRGLRILKLGDLSTAEMNEVAYFDTFPGPDGSSNFGGAWNVYPFFDNGLVMVSDVNRGVFILRPNINQTVDIKDHHSGLWFNAAQSGHGLSVDVLPNNQMVIFWYTYDNQGNPIWLLGAGSYVNNLATLTVNMTRGALFPPLFNPADVEFTEWGTFEFEVSGCNAAEFRWNPNPGLGFEAGNLAMEPLARNAGLSCDEVSP